MAVEVWTNDGLGTVTAGGTTAPSSGTVETWTVTATNAFPVAATGATPPTQFYVCDQNTSYATEKVLVTVAPGGAGAGQTWTVTRGADGTTPLAHTASFTIVQVVTRASLVALQTPDFLNLVTQYGADLTGTTDCHAAFAAAFTALPAQGGVLYLPAGTYRLNSTWLCQLANNQTVMVQGDGEQATIIKYYGAGDAIRFYNPTTYTAGNNISWRSGLRGLTIDGTNATAGSTGLHIGDIGELRLDLRITNFTGTGAIGLHLDNTVTWTEEADVRATVQNSTSLVVFDTTTGHASYGYGSFDFTLYDAGNQNGVVVQAGSFLYHGSLRIRGNFAGSASALTNAVLTVTGKNTSGGPSNNDVSSITATRFDVQVETSSGAHTPQTIVLDATNVATITEGWGILDFYWGATEFAAGTYPPGQFYFSGILYGENGSVNGFTAPAPFPIGWQNYGMGTVLPAGPAVTTGQVNFTQGDVFQFTLSASVTLSFINWVGSGAVQQFVGGVFGAPQRKTIVIKQAAAGGPYTVTWPKPGSPSLTAPAVYWAAGTAPTMTATASATDVYKLESYDGVHWYGQATQNMS